MSGHFAAFCAVQGLSVSTARKWPSAWSSVWRSSVSATERPPWRHWRGLPLVSCQSHKFKAYTLLPFLPDSVCGAGWICAAVWEFCSLVLTVLAGDNRCSIAVWEQGEQQDSPKHVLAGSHKEDGQAEGSSWHNFALQHSWLHCPWVNLEAHTCWRLLAQAGCRLAHGHLWVLHATWLSWAVR